MGSNFCNGYREETLTLQFEHSAALVLRVTECDDHLSFSQVLLLLVAIRQLCAAPLGCSPEQATAEETLRTIRDDYIVMENDPAKFVLKKGDQSQPSSMLNKPCQYKFTETEKNPNQIPSKLATAKCKKIFFGQCDPRCKPEIYYVTVLVKDANCNNKIGQTVWRTKQVPVIIGYDFVR